MEEPEDLETACAGMLNGAMITLLGAAFPVALAWAVLSRWPEFAAGVPEMTRTEALQGGQAITFLVTSVFILRFGLRLFWRNAAYLRRR